MKMWDEQPSISFHRPRQACPEHVFRNNRDIRKCGPAASIGPDQNVETPQTTGRMAWGATPRCLHAGHGRRFRKQTIPVHGMFSFRLRAALSGTGFFRAGFRSGRFVFSGMAIQLTETATPHPDAASVGGIHPCRSAWPSRQDGSAGGI